MVAAIMMRGGSTTTDWVTTLYWNILDRDPDVGGLAMWVRYADHPAYGRAWVAEQIFESLESRERRVNGVYETLLDREAEPGGLAFWSNRVLSTGDLVLRTEIANSSEYWEKAHLRY